MLLRIHHRRLICLTSSGRNCPFRHSHDKYCREYSVISAASGRGTNSLRFMISLQHSFMKFSYCTVESAPARQERFRTDINLFLLFSCFNPSEEDSKARRTTPRSKGEWGFNPSKEDSKGWDDRQIQKKIDSFNPSKEDSKAAWGLKTKHRSIFVSIPLRKIQKCSPCRTKATSRRVSIPLRKIQNQLEIGRASCRERV